MTNSPTNRPLSPSQEDTQPLDTNLGQSEQYPQHNTQEARQYRPAQPGHQLDNYTYQMYSQPQPPLQFLQMIQQQQQASGQALAPPEHVIKNLQSQISSFMDTYPQYAHVAQQCVSPVMDMPQTMQQPIQQSLPMMQQTTPVLVQGPNSPNGFLPTPPPTHKSARIPRRVDTAPMTMNYQIPIVQIQQPMGQDVQLFSDSFGSDYCPSSYQSSQVDPMSPAHSPMKPASMRSNSMPTLFEEMPMPTGLPQNMMASHQLLLSAAENNAYHGYYADSPMIMPLSPREAILANLEVDASIEDTGISAEEVQAYISEQDPADSKWTCLFPECNKKFGRKENIRSHVQTHLGDRQFKCNACGKCFVRQHDLKRHAKIHSGDKPHKCPCGNGFARQDALTRHRQRGVCEGALPGFERREVKRGRPRKNRPDMADRIDKASRARKMDARRGSEQDFYGSSSSSVRSDPYTPPYMADTYESAFGLDADHLENFLQAHQDTPPSSPPTGSPRTKQEDASPAHQSSPQGTATYDFATMKRSVSPKAASTVHSSPAVGGASQGEAFGESIFDWGAVDAQPPLTSDAFSPGAASSNESELDDDAFDSAFGSSKNGDNPTFETLLDFSSNGYNGGMLTGLSTSSDMFAAQMENWLQHH
ncbi:hypothetical protein MBLNU457_2223t1 [Dothideomycetes sp. NU457]